MFVVVRFIARHKTLSTGNKWFPYYELSDLDWFVICSSAIHRTS